MRYRMAHRGITAFKYAGVPARWLLARMWRNYIFVPVLAIGILSGCSEESQPSIGWRGRIDTLESGVVRIANTRSESWPGEPWRLVEELQVGRVEGEGPDVFGRIVGVEVDEDARIYVLDGLSNEVRIFDRRGQHVGTIGRTGSGPGEIKQASGLAWDPDGNLWVVDPGNGRYGVLGRHGAFRRHVPHPTGGLTIPWPGTIDRRGNLFDLGVRFGSVDGFETVLLRMNRDGEVLDTIPLPSFQSPVYRLVRDGLTKIEQSVPFAPRLHRFLDREGTLWFGVSDKYEIIRRSLAGDTLLIVQSSFDRIPVTRKERAQALEGRGITLIRQNGGTVDASLIPDYKPAFSRFVVAGDGTLWVWPVVALSDGAPIDIFGRDGRYLGRIQGPQGLARVPLPVIRGDQMVAVLEDSLGINSVVRLRIER